MRAMTTIFCISPRPMTASCRCSTTCARRGSLCRIGVGEGIEDLEPFNAHAYAEALFGDRLDLCFGQREGKPIKPDPTVLKEMLSMLGITPDECLYAGDTATDMQTGKGAGCFTVGVLWGFRTEKELRDNRADAIVQKPAQILKLIKEKNGK